MLTADVTKLDGKWYPWDFISDDLVELPSTMHAFSFGFSCKDFSSLNNHSSSYKESCIDEQVGSTGRTWGGNMSVASRSKPLYIQMENVPAARRGNNYECIVKDVSKAGYLCMDVALNGAEYGLPQDRARAWFSGLRKDIIFESDVVCSAKFHDAIVAMKLEEPIPITRFILSSTSEYLKDVMEQRQLRQIIKEHRSVHNASAKKKPKRLKWKIDHWRVRRMLNLHTECGDMAEAVSQVAAGNGMCPREADLFQLMVDGGTLDPSLRPAVELKHSAPRVIRPPTSKPRRFRHEKCTSCLLPASRLLVLPPHVPQARYLTGAEALAIQGVPLCYTVSEPPANDSLLLNMAGNAFSGGCAAAVFIASLLATSFPESASGQDEISFN